MLQYLKEGQGQTAKHYDVPLGTTLFVTTDAASSFEFGPNFR
jgi:hypothetical protein